MANNINFGKIYDSTWWGVGVTANTISWGSIYKDLAGVKVLAERFSNRVEADGGVVESLNCVNNADFVRPYSWNYYFRVIDDGGIVESLECVTI